MCPQISDGAQAAEIDLELKELRDKLQSIQTKPPETVISGCKISVLYHIAEDALHLSTHEQGLSCFL